MTDSRNYERKTETEVACKKVEKGEALKLSLTNMRKFCVNYWSL